MDTRTKLGEAKYFLDILSSMANNPDGFYYNLSAFLSAWRSTLDVMLYDFAEHFSLCSTREDDMNLRDFKVVARALHKTEALRFISWWERNQGILGNTPLWKKRNINVHRGSVPLTRQTRTILATGSGGTSGTVSAYSVAVNQGAGSSLGSLVPQAATTPTASVASQDWYFDDLPSQRAIDICSEAYYKMEGIVREAETEFSVPL